MLRARSIIAGLLLLLCGGALIALSVSCAGRRQVYVGDVGRVGRGLVLSARISATKFSIAEVAAYRQEYGSEPSRGVYELERCCAPIRTVPFVSCAVINRGADTALIPLIHFDVLGDLTGLPSLTMNIRCGGDTLPLKLVRPDGAVPPFETLTSIPFAMLRPNDSLKYPEHVCPLALVDVNDLKPGNYELELVFTNPIWQKLPHPVWLGHIRSNKVRFTLVE